MTSTLVSMLEKASYAYHNGLDPIMTDEAYDAAVDQLRDLDPNHPFLTKVGAPIACGSEVELPIPLPSLNKIKDSAAIAKWSGKFSAPTYHVSAKLDGCSALWLPQSKKLYTRGDGLRGRDISAFAPYFAGLVPATTTVSAGTNATTTVSAGVTTVSAGVTTVSAVRGELIMCANSKAIPEGKMARNIVAGALNRKEADPTLFAEIRFVAYELLDTASPEEGFKQMRTAGYEVARAAIIPAAKLTAENLSQVFTAAESKSPYQMDGIVIAPNVVRTSKHSSKNPEDRVAWKTRLTAHSARTTVRQVEWNVSHQGFLIPRVLFDTVTLSGANIHAATGLHGRWIFENGVGPGAEIEIRRAGDVIPQIVSILKRVEPSMPARYQWSTEQAIHVKPVGDDSAKESACIQLTHALAELGAENVGPGIVAKLYAAGYTDLKKIYSASVAELASVDGCKEKGAERIYAGLRVKQSSWTELNFMIASCTMPRGVGHQKLTPLFAIHPTLATWSATSFKAARPAGLSEKTIDAIMDAIPAYLAWKNATGFCTVVSVAPAAATKGTVVFTGVRDKALEEALVAKGYTIADTVTKKTKYLVYADGPMPITTKFVKAKEMGITILSVSQVKTELS